MSIIEFQNKNLNWLPEKFTKNLVSVIIPTFNREVYLEEAIQSVISQSYRPIECIVVDDGSTDKTKEIIEKFISENKEGFTVKYLFQQNAGSQAARNSGTRASSGEFIQHLDSDDILYPGKIINQVQFLNQNPNCDGIWGDWRKGSPGKNEQVKSLPNEDLLSQFLAEDCIHTLSFLFRRSIVQKIGEWDERIKRNQEIDFQVRGLLAGANYKYQSQECGLWRIHSGDRIGNTTGFSEILQFYDLWEDRLKHTEKLNERIKVSMANTLFWAAVDDKKSNDPNRFNMLIKAVKLNPYISFYNTKKMKYLTSLLGKQTAIKLWWRWFKQHVKPELETKVKAL